MQIKTILLFISLGFTISYLTYAQENCGNGIDDDGDELIDCLDPDCTGDPPSSFYFNTGNNGLGGVLPGGASDFSWMVSNSFTGSYSPAIVMNSIPGVYYSSPWPNSAWISFDASGFHSYAGGDVDYYFKINFLLPCFNECGLSYTTPGTFCLTLDYFADNSIYEIWVNGVPQSAILGTLPLPDPYYNFGYIASGILTASLCQNWLSGTNEVIVRVSSGPDHLALLVQSSINQFPHPTASINGTTSVCQYGPAPNIIFTGSGTPPFTFTYKINGGFNNMITTSSTTITLSVSTNTAGIFKYSLVSVQDSNSISCPNAMSDSAIVTVRPKPTVNLGTDALICPDSSIILDTGISGALYIWSTGAKSQTISVNSLGLYWVNVTANNCTSSDSIKVSMIPRIDLGNDGSLCDKSEIFLKSNIPASTYLWSTGQTTPEIKVQEPGIYWLTADYQNCKSTDSIEVIGSYSTLYVPNAFTPNKDGLNDEFKPISEGIVKYHMMIFNRWGEMVFETADLTTGWDGIYKGKLVDNGTFAWVIIYRTICSGYRDLQKFGYVILMK